MINILISKKYYSSVSIELNIIDISFIVLLLFELLNYSNSVYQLNSIYFLFDIFIAFIIYWLLRLGLKTEFLKEKLFIIIVVIVSILSILTIRYYYLFASSLKSLGFTDYTDFRHLFTPFNCLPNELVTVVLCFLPFSIFLVVKYWDRSLFRYLFGIIALLNIHTVLIFFSRGALIALISFFIISSLLLLFFKIVNFKKLLIFNIIVILLSFLLILPYSKSVISTISINKSLSHKRSIEGRLNIWASSIKICKDYPIFGIGSKNFGLVNITYKIKNQDINYTGRVLNTFLQILIEKGIVGFIIYGGLLISFILISALSVSKIKNDKLKQILICINIASIVSILIREITYSSILENKAIIILVSIIFAINSNESHKILNIDKLNYKLGKLLFPVLILLMPALWLCFKSFNINTIIKHNSQFINYFRQDRYYEANVAVDKLISISPAHAYSQKALLIVNSLNGIFINKITNDTAIVSLKKKELEEAIILYEEALKLNPYDDSYHHNLSWLYFITHNYIKSREHINTAIQIDDKIAVYYITKGRFYEYKNNIPFAFNEYCNAIKLAPDILDSEFFEDIQKRYPVLADSIICSAINYLDSIVSIEYNPIMSAKLGKLYINKNKFNLASLNLEKVTKELPNLNRPWYYLSVLDEKNGETSNIELYLKRSIFLDNTDFLPYIRLGDYYSSKPDDDNCPKCNKKLALDCYENALDNWVKVSSVHYSRVFWMYHLKSINNDLIPCDLLTYCMPYVNSNELCQKISNLYAETDNKKLPKYFFDTNTGKIKRMLK